MHSEAPIMAMAIPLQEAVPDARRPRNGILPGDDMDEAWEWYMVRSSVGRAPRAAAARKI
jgi:hypothetical protein